MEVSVSQRPEKHGVFYPRGYVIVTFESAEKAADVRQRLLEGGYDENDVQVMDAEQVRQGRART